MGKTRAGFAVAAPLNSEIMIFLRPQPLPFLKRILAACIFVASSAVASALTIDNRTVTLEALTNTTVTMTGRSELIVTGTGNPLPGCIIHLDSPDAWLFLREIRPFTLNGSFLGKVRVNGADASTRTNVRIVHHGMDPSSSRMGRLSPRSRFTASAASAAIR
jgi:hypothetical protein